MFCYCYCWRSHPANENKSCFLNLNVFDRKKKTEMQVHFAMDLLLSLNWLDASSSWRGEVLLNSWAHQSKNLRRRKEKGSVFTSSGILKAVFKREGECRVNEDNINNSGNERTGGPVQNETVWDVMADLEHRGALLLVLIGLQPFKKPSPLFKSNYIVDWCDKWQSNAIAANIYCVSDIFL